MLAPIAHRCSARGLFSTLVPTRALATSLQDSWRPFSCAFPIHSLNGLQSRQRFLHVQSASKASLPKDPERPKRPQSAFFRFGASQREVGVKQVSKIAEAWRQLAPVQKLPFEQAAAADQAVYKKVFEQYKASGKYDAWKRDPAKPKKPLIPFMSWSLQERKSPALANLPVAEAAKKLGVAWKALSASQKAPFETAYTADKEKYAAQVKVYQASGAEEEWLEKTGRSAVTKKAEAKKQALKDKLTEAKAKKMAKNADTKEKAKIATAKAAKAKSAKAEAAKAKASKEKAIKAKAVEARAVKAAADKVKAKLAKAKANEKAIKAKEAKTAKAKADKEKKEAATAKAKSASDKKKEAASIKVKKAKATKAPK